MIGFLLLVQSTTQKNNQKTQKKMIKSIDRQKIKVYNITIKGKKKGEQNEQHSNNNITRSH